MRVLFLTHRLPYAPNRGDRVRAFHMLKALARFAEVDLVSLVHDDDEARQVGTLKAVTESVTIGRVPKGRNLLRGVAALSTNQPLTQVLLHAPGLDGAVADLVARRAPDVVLAYCSSMAALALGPSLASIPYVLDFVDVDSQKWSDLAVRARRPMRWIYQREARHLGSFEARAATQARAALVVNEREAAVARRLAPRANVMVIENGIDLDHYRFTHEPTSAPTAVFCGVMNYKPNEEGALWLAQSVWPLVRAHRPDARLQLVGASPTSRLISACSSDASIEVTGTVPDVRPFLWNAAVSVAPLLVARGIQNKVLEAVASGLPAIVTPAVAAGLPPGVHAACTVADSPERYAAEIVRLLGVPPEERRRIATSASLGELDWSRTLSSLRSILESATESRGSEPVASGFSRTLASA